MIYPHFPLNRLLFSHIKEQHKDAVVKEVEELLLNALCRQFDDHEDHLARQFITIPSWLNCVLRGDEVVYLYDSNGWYLVVLGQYRAILVDT